MKIFRKTTDLKRCESKIVLFSMQKINSRALVLYELNQITIRYIAFHTYRSKVDPKVMNFLTISTFMNFERVHSNIF